MTPGAVPRGLSLLSAGMMGEGWFYQEGGSKQPPGLVAIRGQQGVALGWAPGNGRCGRGWQEGLGREKRLAPWVWQNGRLPCRPGLKPQLPPWPAGCVASDK